MDSLLIKIKKLFLAILDFLFPIPEEQEELELITPEKLFSESEPSLDTRESYVFSVFGYGGLIKRMIICLKNYYSPKIAKVFAEILYPEILEILSDARIFENFKNPILIPIPVSKKKLRERKYNQIELVANELIKIDQNKTFTLNTKSLLKIKDTQKQALVSKKEDRLKNPIGCFAVKHPEKIKDRNIILLDDVYTTGGTTKEARRILLESDAKKVIILTLAH